MNNDDIHARVRAFLQKQPSWASLDPEVVARGHRLVQQQLLLDHHHNDDAKLRDMLAWFRRPEIIGRRASM